MLQAVNRDGRRFAVERDIINLFPAVVGGAATALARNAMPPAVRDFATHTGVTDADVIAACRCMAEFINISRDEVFLGDDLPAAYIRSRMDRVPQAAAVALYANLGMVLTNAYFKYIREAMPKTVSTPGLDAMTEILERTAHTMAAGTQGAKDRRAAELAAESERLIKDQECQ